jgi:hypothetical protein
VTATRAARVATAALRRRRLCARFLAWQAGWSSAALWQRRHESVRLRLGRRGELSGQRVEVTRGDRALGLGEHSRELVPMRLEVLRERRMEDLLRRPPLELCEQTQRRVVALEDPKRRPLAPPSRAR